KLQEVGRGAVGFERGVILVLFVDEEAARFGLVLVHLVHHAAGFFTGFGSEFLQQRRHFGLASGLCDPRYRQYHHPSLRLFSLCNFAFQFRTAGLLRGCRPNWLTKSATRIVCSRSGPVEIIPTRARVCSSMKARYSRAALGSASSFRMSCVGVAQP